MSSPRLEEADGACDWARDRVRAGEFSGTVDGSRGAVAGVVRVGAGEGMGIVRGAGEGIVPTTFTPPWCEQAPRPGLLVEPSAQLTVERDAFACLTAAFCSALTAFFARFVAALSTPP